jgi:hypothetical protein
VGLVFLYSVTSNVLPGVGMEAEHIASLRLMVHADGYGS